MNKNLQQYLEENFRNRKIDFSLRISHSEDGNIQFYIHPQNENGETLDFKVIGNSVLNTTTLIQDKED